MEVEVLLRYCAIIIMSWDGEIEEMEVGIVHYCILHLPFGLTRSLGCVELWSFRLWPAV